ncbi:MAG: helix-turn-helix transcriptional regulator [Eubacterium sp.]|nr:helix-turn-helix transcriptional regulator [Eubacterium sp.]
MTIKELRTQEGLSQSEMAKKLGIATSAIGHMENGRMKVSPKIAAKAKEEFGMDLDIEPKAARKPVKEKVKAAEAKVEKAKAARKTKKTVKKADAAAKKSTSKLEIIVQSPMGGNISDAEIAAKLPKGTETVFVRVDQNKLWWIKGEETGSVDIW